MKYMKMKGKERHRSMLTQESNQHGVERIWTTPLSQ